MKNIPAFIRIISLFILSFYCIAPHACAQKWLWARQSRGAEVESWAVATDATGNVYAASQVEAVGTVTFGSMSTPSSAGIVWVKYDPAGNVLWTGGTVSGSALLFNITTDPAGNLIIVGAFADPSMQIGPVTLTNPTGTPQFFIAKISPSGTVVWAINDGTNILFADPYLLGVGFKGFGNAATDSSGNIYITSSFEQTSTTIGPYTFTNSDPTGATYDAFIAKYSPAGSLLWATPVGGKGNEYALGITVSSTGYPYICGSFTSPSVTLGSSVISDPYGIGKPLAYIAKFSAAGVPLWAQAAGGKNMAFASSLAKDNAGNVYMTGSFYDPTITFGSTTITQPYPVGSKLAAFLVQYSPANIITWGKSIGSRSSGISAFSIAYAACGQVWIGATYGDAAVIDPGDTLAFISGSDPIFIAGYDLSGGTAGYTALPSGGDDRNQIACDPMGNVFMSGDFVSLGIDTTALIGPDTLSEMTNGEYLFVAKYGRPADTTYKRTVTCTSGNAGITLTATKGYTNYLWDNGATTQNRDITAPGNYFVYGISCGAAVNIDSFAIIIADTVNTHSDMTLCATSGGTILSAPAGYNSPWLWSTGSPDSSITESGSGSYWVMATQLCTTKTDTFNLTFFQIPNVSLGNDTGFCSGASIELQCAQPPGYTYLWNNGSTSNSINITDSGTYWLTVNNNNCFGSDTIHISESFSPAVIALGPDTTLCKGDQIVLSAGADIVGLIWSTGANSPDITVVETGTYWASTSTLCGTASDTVKINFALCNIWFPSAFTPNDDGLNDIAHVLGNLKFFTGFSLSIYNRWGQQVFYTQDISSGWDGTFNGVKQDIGTYFYIIDYTLEGKKHMMKGDLELIR